jgi:hypothetical protein
VTQDLEDADLVELGMKKLEIGRLKKALALI